MKKIVVAMFMLLCISKAGYAQTFSELVCKEWMMTSGEKNGKIQPAAPDQQKDRMFFYADHKVLSIESGYKENGSWTYDSTKKLLTVKDNQTKEVMKMDVVKIDTAEFVIGLKDPEGQYIKIHMAPVKKVN